MLILSQYVEPTYTMRVLEEHPERVDYLLTERVFDVAILIDALRRIADGETVIAPTIVSHVLGRRLRARSLAELTERKREVLGLVAEGLSNRAIAARLVTERTVEAHAKQIFRKLDIDQVPDSSVGCSPCLHSSDRAGRVDPPATREFVAPVGTLEQRAAIRRVPTATYLPMACNRGFTAGSSLLANAVRSKFAGIFRRQPGHS